NLAAPPFPYPGTNLDCYTSPRALGITPDSPDVPGPAPTHEGGAEYGASASGSGLLRTGPVAPHQRREDERAAAEGVDRWLLTRNQVRPQWIQKRFQQGNGSRLLGADGLEAPRHQPVGNRHLSRSVHEQDAQLPRGRHGL